MKVNVEVEYDGKSVMLEDVEMDDGISNDEAMEEFVGNFQVTITNAETGDNLL